MLVNKQRWEINVDEKIKSILVRDCCLVPTNSAMFATIQIVVCHVTVGTCSMSSEFSCFQNGFRRLVESRNIWNRNWNSIAFRFDPMFFNNGGKLFWNETFEEKPRSGQLDWSGCLWPILFYIASNNFRFSSTLIPLI